MTFASNEKWPISENAKEFNSLDEAKDYAFEEMQDEYYEYGIRILDDEE